MINLNVEFGEYQDKYGFVGHGIICTPLYYIACNSLG